MPRYICVHGHFYQPPRENPWLETIELQDSAYPYHDWNERITAECYAPNAFSRILDGQDRIVRIVNNYARISFNCGPTLLAWMEKGAPEVYAAILEADRESARTFAGHGSAMAQPYNHMILPLANARDRRTQVVWGLRDFRRRFGRDPEGMWLPETAVDVPTLETLAEAGVRFTVLAPSQARAVRAKGAREWREANGDLDPSRPYDCPLPSGRRIAIFFYDGPISRAVAFERLLQRGENLVSRLMGAFHEGRDWPQIVHIATDGETYGHHHPHGDMALAYALDTVESRGLATLTNYAAYLARHPPDHEAQVHESSSWSCVHGLERWRSNCGCNSGGHPEWHQEWRAPLREALDWLRDELAEPFAREAGRLLRDPWAARDEYVEVILDRAPERRRGFLERHGPGGLDEAGAVRAWKLLELQRHLMLMYTSCGWFFDELSGIETVQVVQYAGRALQLAEDVLDLRLEEAFLARLGHARSNLPEHGDGRRIFLKFVKPAAVDHSKVGGHYAISSLFHRYEDREIVYCYEVCRREQRVQEAGSARLLTGHADVASRVTGEARRVTYGVLHWGDHNISGGVRAFRGEEAYAAMEAEVGEAFGRADFPEVVRLFDRHFGSATYSLRSLFRDEQRSILRHLLRASLEEAEGVYRQIHERRAPLMRFLTDLGIPLPRPFRAAAELVINATLRAALEGAELDQRRVEELMQRAEREGVTLDVPALSYALRRSIERLARQYLRSPSNLGLLRKLVEAVRLARAEPFDLDLWAAQNRYHEVSERLRPAQEGRAREGDDEAQAWLAAFQELGQGLGFAVPE
jgi:alpha-amylase/alpha-mannosidase (GH57 family)